MYFCKNFIAVNINVSACRRDAEIVILCMAKKQKASAKKIAAKMKPKLKEEAIKEYFPVEPLMPELDELVKKNPNRLIGCGG